jgi:hypothetical protein
LFERSIMYHKCANEEGISPVSLLLLSHKSQRFVMFPKLAGMTPVKAFLFKTRDSRFGNEPISDGIAPVSWLLKKSRVYKFWSWPMSGEIPPVSRLLLKKKYRRPVSLYRDVGMMPTRPLPPKSSS